MVTVERLALDHCNANDREREPPALHEVRPWRDSVGSLTTPRNICRTIAKLGPLDTLLGLGTKDVGWCAPEESELTYNSLIECVPVNT